MSYGQKSAIGIYRSKVHASLQRNYQLTPALKCETVSSCRGEVEVRIRLTGKPERTSLH
jgi:hypothetical protein